jgi:hypothetical protein
MEMIIKIAIWGLLFYWAFILNREVLVPKNLMILVLITQLLLFFAYMALLYWEIRTRTRKAATQKQLRWAGFHFTFWVGFLWWMPFGSLQSESLFYHPVNFFSFVASMTISGILFGIVGMAITQFMIIYVFKQPEQI